VLYRLEFGTTAKGYLKVVGLAKGTSPVSTVHIDENLLASVVTVSRIPKAVELVNATRHAYDVFRRYRPHGTTVRKVVLCGVGVNHD
jgi:hypothetical protein